jgi:hypothetical protein
MSDTIRKIIAVPCPHLNIKDRKGATGYIDFIQENELGDQAVMKGVDCIGRPFIAVKTEFVLPNGRTVPAFSTFFQRYVDETFLWQCCGHDGELLMHTEGGMRPEQFDFLLQLLDEKVVDLDTNPAEIIQKIRLNYNTDDIASGTGEEEEDKILPFQVRLREKNNKKNYTSNPRFVF